MNRLILPALISTILLVACRTDQTTLWKSDRVYLNSEFGCVHNAWQPGSSVAATNGTPPPCRATSTTTCSPTS